MSQNLVDKVLKSKSLMQCLENWSECNLEDVLCYELGQKLQFSKHRQEHSDVIELENVIQTYSLDDKRKYLRTTVKEFLRDRLSPKRKELHANIPKRATKLMVGGILFAGAAVSGVLFLPTAYMPFLYLGCAAAGAAGFGVFKYAQAKDKKEIAADTLITARDVALFQELKNNFDVDSFFEKYKESFSTKVKDYWKSYDQIHK